MGLAYFQYVTQRVRESFFSHSKQSAPVGPLLISCTKCGVSLMPVDTNGGIIIDVVKTMHTTNVYWSRENAKINTEVVES